MRTSTHRRLSCSSISHAGSSFITWCFRWVTFVCPALSVHGGASTHWLIVGNSSICRGLGQVTVHSYKKKKYHTRLILTLHLELLFLLALKMHRHYSFSIYSKQVHFYINVRYALSAVKKNQGKCLVEDSNQNHML